jgi:CheY-like chemotaxis protein
LKKKLKSVLLIDDDEVANFLHSCILEELNVTNTIVTLTNGFEGLKYLKNNEFPDLLLLDLNMPLIDGKEFLESFNDLPIKGKEAMVIIVLSSSRRLDDIQDAIGLGAIDFIVKPLSEKKLREILDEYFY